MALQKSTTIKGIPMTESYTIVSSANYLKPDDRVYFHIYTFYNAGSRNDSIDNYIDRDDFKFQPSGSYSIVDNDIATACYNYLKTLDAWSGSVDV